MTILDSFWRVRGNVSAAVKIDTKRRLVGSIDLDTVVKDDLCVLNSNGDLIDIQVNGSYCPAQKLPINGRASFIIRAPSNYFENLDELILRHPHSPPVGYRIFDASDDKLKIPLYVQAIKVAELMRILAFKIDNKGCILFANGGVEIPFIYTKSDLRFLDNLDEIFLLMSSSDNLSIEGLRLLDVYRSLFCQALADIVSSSAKDKRFPYLLDNFSDCVFRFRLSFKRFSDEANKAIERFEQNRAAMISALNGVLGNIQTSLIGIPLAGLLALKELKPSQGFTFENVIISSAVVIVGALLMALSFSQGKTLKAIEDQHCQLVSEIENSGGGKTKIASALTLMGSHQSYVSMLLIVVRVIIGFLICMAIGVLIFR